MRRGLRKEGGRGISLQPSIMFDYHHLFFFPCTLLVEILAIFHLTSLNNTFIFVALFYIINLVSIFYLDGSERNR